jgi:hypothetical protein
MTIMDMLEDSVEEQGKRIKVQEEHIEVKTSRLKR